MWKWQCFDHSILLKVRSHTGNAGPELACKHVLFDSLHSGFPFSVFLNWKQLPTYKKTVAKNPLIDVLQISPTVPQLVKTLLAVNFDKQKFLMKSNLLIFSFIVSAFYTLFKTLFMRFRTILTYAFFQKLYCYAFTFRFITYIELTGVHGSDPSLFFSMGLSNGSIAIY